MAILHGLDDVHVFVRYGHAIANGSSCTYMQLNITRVLVPKQTDDVGVERAAVQLEPTSLTRALRVKSWNDGFFEVIVLDADITQDVAFATAGWLVEELDEEVDGE